MQVSSTSRWPKRHGLIQSSIFSALWHQAGIGPSVTDWFLSYFRYHRGCNFQRFYQDLNFTKEQIAEAVKIYGVIFSLVGGFLGGLLAQRMNIMKLMFVGAVLASSTNLIFIGLVKSGHQLGQVQVNVGGQQYLADTDEVGYWTVKVPTEVLKIQPSFRYLPLMPMPHNKVKSRWFNPILWVISIRRI